MNCSAAFHCGSFCSQSVLCSRRKVLLLLVVANFAGARCCRSKGRGSVFLTTCKHNVFFAESCHVNASTSLLVYCMRRGILAGFPAPGNSTHPLPSFANRPTLYLLQLDLSHPTRWKLCSLVLFCIVFASVSCTIFVLTRVFATLRRSA